MAREKTEFKLANLPLYVYPIGLACPECYRPLESAKRQDGRCVKCLHDKKVLPVNYLRTKKRDEEDEDEYAYRSDE